MGMEKRAARRGSPPRVRGTAFAVSANIFISRITPACAGNSSYVTAGTASIKDHPRVCGEQVHVPLHTFPVPGSPPRVRGTVSFGFGLDSDSRITPACAGNRRPSGCWRVWSPDHPRVCGEQRPGSVCPGGEKGSPPRVRGTGPMGQREVRPQGITPACAGNSARRMPEGDERTDHPRVCGEQLRTRISFSTFIGSPPRVRGTGGEISLSLIHI